MGKKKDNAKARAAAEFLAAFEAAKARRDKGFLVDTVEDECRLYLSDGWGSVVVAQGSKDQLQSQIAQLRVMLRVASDQIDAWEE